jgi:hypothetical protein
VNDAANAAGDGRCLCTRAIRDTDLELLQRLYSAARTVSIEKRGWNRQMDREYP